MRILIADIFLIGQKNCDWKEGYELYYAFKDLGYDCDISGKNGEIDEMEIPKIADNYDLIIITDNYPSGWKWWNWSEIKTPKLFWAIDTHLVNFLPWIQSNNINYVAFNNPSDMEKYGMPDSFWLPYAASKKHHLIEYTKHKIRDLVFIGGLLPERARICEKFNIQCLNVYGPDYIRELQSSKICFNQSMSYDINAKYFEILSSGSFMLTNYNEHFHKFVDYNSDIEKMFYKNEEELGDKIKFYLENEKEREDISYRVKEYIYKNHTWHNRAKTILENIIRFNNINKNKN